MVGIRRAFMAVTIAVASLGTAGVASLVAATPSGASSPPACTDSWMGPTTGTTSWNASSTNWSAGFPIATSVVCINVPGTYTVDLPSSSNASISALEVGGASSGTQTVEIDGSATSVIMSVTAESYVESGGVLTLDPATNGYAMINGTGGSLDVQSGGTLSTSGSTTNPAYLRVPITNESGGTVSLGASVNDQDSDTLTTNDGSFSVLTNGSLTLSGSSSFTQAAGSLSVGGTLTQDGGTFTQTGGTLSGSLRAVPRGVHTRRARPDRPLAWPNGYPQRTNRHVGWRSQRLRGGAVVRGGSARASHTHRRTAETAPGSAERLRQRTGSAVRWISRRGAVSGPFHGASTPVGLGPAAWLGRMATTANGFAMMGADARNVAWRGTLTVSESVTVNGPTISALSKDVITVGKHATIKISGTGFDSTAAVTVSDPAITVVSVTLGRVTKKHPQPMLKVRLAASKTAATGPFSLTITQDTGAVTAVNAITIVPKT